MPINRTWWNNLIDDDGSGVVGTNWNKATIAGLLDAIDAMFPQGVWTAVDLSGAGLTFSTAAAGLYMRSGGMVWAAFDLAYPATANGAAAMIGGLPYATYTQAGGGGIGYTNFGDVVNVLPVAGQTKFGLYTKTGAPISNAAMTSKNLTGFITYLTAAP